METLPTDILHVITTSCKIRDVLALSATCRHMRSFVANNYVSTNVTVNMSYDMSLDELSVKFGSNLINNVVLTKTRFYPRYASLWKNARNLKRIECADTFILSLETLQLPLTLQSLDVSSNRITDFSAVAKLNICDLNIGFNLTTDLGFLRGMRLTTLNISGLKLTYDQLCELPYGNPIVDLDVGLCDVTDLRFLANMKNLRRVVVNSTRLTDISTLTQFANTLNDVTIYSQALVNITPLADLQKCLSLTLAYTISSSIKPISYMNLTTLTFINCIVDSYEHVPKSVKRMYITDALTADALITDALITDALTAITPGLTVYGIIPGLRKLSARVALYDNMMPISHEDYNMWLRDNNYQATLADLHKMFAKHNFAVTVLRDLRRR